MGQAPRRVRRRALHHGHKGFLGAEKETLPPVSEKEQIIVRADGLLIRLGKSTPDSPILHR